MKINHCKVNHLENPMGYWMKNTVFSWVAEEIEVQQSRICVWQEKKLILDTGWGTWNPLGTEVDIKLKPRTIYTWQVSVMSPNGNTAESEINSFETGKRDEKWEASWISCDSEEKRLPIFFREFHLSEEKQIKRARLYICGLGVYEAYLNGKKIGDEMLAPGWNAYDQWIQAQTYDITELLRIENQIEILLGDGWYKGRFGFAGDCNYGDSLKLLGEIHISYTDDTEEVVVTDEQWSVKRSNLLFSGIYDGEQRDDTQKASPVSSAILVQEEMRIPDDRLSVPILEQETFSMKVVHTPKGEMVLDAGQNMAGVFRLRVREPYGKKIHLQFGEVLQDGNFYRDNLRGAKAEYIYISDGKEKIVQPTFTYYGYRYVKVEGISDYRDGDFVAAALYSKIPELGKLKTGHEKVNQLISNTIWGMKSNFVGNPTDCPQRDERMGWTGDAQVFCETACYLADTYLFYQKYLHDMMQEQKKFDGMVPEVVPTFQMKKGCSVWGDAICIIPWTLYQFYGDKTILNECYSGMKEWLRYIRKVDGTDHGWRKIFHYGDWLALDSLCKGETQVKGGTDEGFIADVYYRKSALITAKTAEILDFKKEAEEFYALADTILQEIRNEFFSPNGRCCIQTQTALLLTIKEGLHSQEKAGEMLRELLLCNENKLTTGFVGTPILCEGLVQCGMLEEAFQILLNEEYPGWLYEVNSGATTIWERWNSIEANGHISPTGMNSLNHYAYGSIVAWLWKDVAGIRSLEEQTGFQTVKIRPQVYPDLKYLDAVYPSAAGTYKVYWEVLDLNHIHMKFSIPANCKADIMLPYFSSEEADFDTEVWNSSKKNPVYKNLFLENKTGGSFLVKAGEYEITYRTSEPIIKVKTVDNLMRELMADYKVRKVLEKELTQLEHIILFGAEYPLRETLTNLGYENSYIENVNEKIMQACMALK